MPNELQWEIFKKSLEATIEEGIELTKGQINENSTIKLEKFKSIAWETVDNSYYESIGDYQTLNHGDAWQNNAMFRYYNEYLLFRIKSKIFEQQSTYSK